MPTAYQMIVSSTPTPSPTGLYRTVFVVEVLSDGPIEDIDLADLADEVTVGGSSGSFGVLHAAEVSRADMANYLQAQGSDPQFLLGDDWPDA